MTDNPSTPGGEIRELRAIKDRPRELMAEIADGASHDFLGTAQSGALVEGLKADVLGVIKAQAYIHNARVEREEGIISPQGSSQVKAEQTINTLHRDLDITSHMLIETVADSHGKLNGQLAELVGDRLSRKELDSLIAQYTAGQKEVEDSKHFILPDNKAGIAEGNRLEQEALRKLMPAVEQGVEASIDTARPDTHKVAITPMKTV